MCLVSNPEELTKKKAYLAPLVERLGNMPAALSMVNNRGEDALYLAAMNCPEMPYVTGYLAAAILQKGIDISQKLYHIRVSFLVFSRLRRFAGKSQTGHESAGPSKNANEALLANIDAIPSTIDR